MIDRTLLRLKLRDVLPRPITGPTVPPFAICRVDPREIRSYLEYAVLQKYRSAGRIEPGEWDLQAKPLSVSPKYRLLRGYYDGRLEGEDLTAEVLREAGYPEREARSYAAYGYDTYLEELFASIRERGIELERDAPQAERTADRYDQVAVNVGRDGELIFNSCGFHRLVASQLVGLEAIPVRINAIHDRWWRAHRDGANPFDGHPELTYAGRIPIRWRDVLARA